MKKAERKILKKAIKENIKANLVLVLRQTTTDLGSVDAKFEKHILKGAEKLAKKLAAYIRPIEPSEKAMAQPAIVPVDVKDQPAKKNKTQAPTVKAGVVSPS